MTYVSDNYTSYSAPSRLTLTDALQHATALELAMRDSKDIHPSSAEPVHSMRTGAKHQKPRRNYNQQHTAGCGGAKRSC